MTTRVLLGCEHCGEPLTGIGRRFCSQRCWWDSHPEQLPPTDSTAPIEPQGLASTLRLNRKGPHRSIPVIQVLTDINFRDCWRASCACGFQSPPYIDLDAARAVAWEHLEATSWKDEGAHLGLEDRGALQQRALSDRAIGKIAEALNVSLATVGNDLAPELSPTDNSGAAQEKPGPREKLTWKQKAHPAPCGGARGSQRGGRIRTSTSTTLNSTGTPYAAKSLASACNSRWLSDSQLSGMTRKILRG